jgi:hypothetical protein
VFVAVFVPVYAFVRVLTWTLQVIRWPRWGPGVARRIGIRRRVLYLEVFFPEASGYVYRVTNWTRLLDEAGFTTRIRHPLSQ